VLQPPVGVRKNLRKYQALGPAPHRVRPAFRTEPSGQSPWDPQATENEGDQRSRVAGFGRAVGVRGPEPEVGEDLFNGFRPLDESE